LATRELKEQLAASKGSGGRRKRKGAGISGDGEEDGIEGVVQKEIKKGYYGGGSGGKGGALHNQRGSAQRKKRKHH
jgi:hypothetical protein